MKLDYYLIQYVDDPLKNERKNVGVIAHDGFRPFIRMLGHNQADGSVDSSYFAALSERARTYSWLYDEWISWFRTVVRHEGRTPDTLFYYLKNLEATGASFVAVAGGKLDLSGRLAAMDSDIDELFRVVVDKPVRPAVNRFDEIVRDLFERAGISNRADLDSDVEVEFFDETGDVAASVLLPFILKDKPRIVFKIVRVRTADASFFREINDAIVSFAHVVKHGFAKQGGCIVLTETPTQRKFPHLKRLAAHASVIDVTSGSAAEVLSSIIAAQTAA